MPSEVGGGTTPRHAGRLESLGTYGLAGLIVVTAICCNFVGGAPMAYTLMVLTLLAIVWSLAWRRPIWTLRAQPAQAMFLLAFLLLAVAYSVTAHQLADIRYVFNFLMLACFVPLSNFFGRLVRPENSGRVALLALVGAIFSVAVALFQHFGLKQDRVVGYGSDPIWSAEAAHCGRIHLDHRLVRTAPADSRWLFLLGPVLAIVTTSLTDSRGPLLAAPFLALTVIVAAGRKARFSFVAALLVAAVALGGLYFVWPTGATRLGQLFETVRDILSGTSIEDASASIRLTFWQIGFEAFLHAPLFGYGWAHFLAAAYGFLPDHGASFRATIIPGNIHLHADILDFGVSGGITGLLAYGLIMAAPLVDAFRSPRDSQYLARRTGAALLVVGYFVCGLTYLMFGYEFHTTLYVVLSAILVSLCRDAPAAGTAKPPLGAGNRSN